MKKIDNYLETLQCEETSNMTFHVDSPHGKKKKVLRAQYPTEDNHIDIIRKRLMIDFDGVIHDYTDGWNDGKITGGLIPGSAEAIEILRQDYEIVIFTTRAAPPEEEEGQSNTEQVKAVSDWLKQQGVYFDKITGEKLGAIAYIDDKGIRFEGNWKYVLDKINEIQNTREGSNTV